MLQGGPRKISPFFIPAAIINLAAGQVSIRYGAKGPNEATATACTTSAHSIGDAYRIIERGDADVMIAGGSEAAITPMGIGGFAAMRALSTRNDDPAHACRPFDKDRDGFVVRRGIGHPDPRRSGARQSTRREDSRGNYRLRHERRCAPHHRHARGWRRLLPLPCANALKSAKIEPHQIDYVNAHATSTTLGDVVESKAMQRLFGEHATSHKLMISSTKSMTGHLLGGAGGLEAGITILALLNQTAPPTANLDHPDPECVLNYVPNQPQKGTIHIALSNSFGFGGTNGSLIFRRWE